jgi:hypothetical protein
MSSEVRQFDDRWLISREDMWLPQISIVIVSDDDAMQFTTVLDTFVAKWGEAFNVAGQGAGSHLGAAGTKDWRILVLVLLSQAAEVLEKAAKLVDSAAQRGFKGVAVAAIGEQPEPDFEQMAERCLMAIITTEMELLLHPVRILCAYKPLIGYDLADVQALYAGRIAQVRRTLFDANAQPPIEIAHGPNVVGCCCLMLSNSEGRLRVGDAILSPVLERANAGALDLMCVMNGHWDTEDSLEWAIVRERHRR